MYGLLDANVFRQIRNIAVSGGFPAKVDTHIGCTEKIYMIKGVNQILIAIGILKINMELLQLFYVKIIEKLKNLISVKGERSQIFTIPSFKITLEAPHNKFLMGFNEGLGTPSTIIWIV
jgi:hypothetical protein